MFLSQQYWVIITQLSSSKLFLRRMYRNLVSVLFFVWAAALEWLQTRDNILSIFITDCSTWFNIIRFYYLRTARMLASEANEQTTKHRPVYIIKSGVYCSAVRRHRNGVLMCFWATCRLMKGYTRGGLRYLEIFIITKATSGCKKIMAPCIS